MAGRSSINDIARHLASYLSAQADLGIEGLYLPDWGQLAVADSGERLERLRLSVADCQKCALAATRTNLVFGEGDPDADLMFVGEAPGRDEDIQGAPFVGRAGQLLNRIISAMGMKREEVYIGNVLKCRPPGNRDPLPDEVANCLPILHRQVAIIRPKIICALGRVAAQNLLGTKAPLAALRGKFHDFHGIPVLVTYHPAAILRNPNLKRPTWEDMQIIMKYLGLKT